MKQKILLVFVTLSFLSINSCDDDIVGPQPGRRDYVWTEDTIKVTDDYLLLTRIWAYSPTYVWATGESAAFKVWFYDGKSWQLKNAERAKPGAVWGAGMNEVWIGDKYNKIWKYNGSGWSLFQEFKIEGFDNINIEDMSGSSSNDIYAAGAAVNYTTNNYKGIILHYDGKKWNFVNIPDLKVSFDNIEIEKKTNRLFLLASNYDNGFLDKIFVYDGSGIKEVISSYDGFGLGSIEGEIYINTTPKLLYKYVNNNLVLWKDFSGTTFQYNIHGRSEKDFISGSSDGIGHYNGTDYQTIYKTSLEINGIAVLEKDIFAISRDYSTGNNVIIHGVLK